MAGASRSDTVRCESCGTMNRLQANAQGVPRCGKCHSNLPWVTQAVDEDFEDIVERSPLPVVVDLWAEWCGPCRMVSPALEEIARQMAGRLKLVKVDVDKSPSLSRRFDVQGIPTLLLVHHGEVIGRQVGAAPGHAIRQWVDKALASPRP